jgi:hypothetical protein
MLQDGDKAAFFPLADLPGVTQRRQDSPFLVTKEAD